jgi:uncharacterized protein YeaO (DUF488 family)
MCGAWFALPRNPEEFPRGNAWTTAFRPGSQITNENGTIEGNFVRITNCVTKRLNIAVKRVYDTPQDEDGYRILVDRLWPRGIRKESARLDEWNKNLAPSTSLRKWFHQEDGDFTEFARLYKREVSEQKGELARLKKLGKEQKITLLFGSRDLLHNHAVLLLEVLKSPMA